MALGGKGSATAYTFFSPRPAVRIQCGSVVRVSPSTGHDAALQENQMQLEQRTQGDIVIVKVTGDITLNQGGDVQVKDKVQSLLQQGQKKIVLDLGEVAYVDSAGLGQLVQAYATTKNQGGSLKLINLGKKLRDLLVVTKLVTVFDTYDSEGDAIKSFG
jgi:anti-sigma B factor antagonist